MSPAFSAGNVVDEGLLPAVKRAVHHKAPCGTQSLGLYNMHFSESNDFTNAFIWPLTLLMD